MPRPAPPPAKGMPEAGGLSAGQILLEQRRAELREAEEAWSRMLDEVEAHLADVTSAPAAEAEKAGAAYQKAKLAREVAELKRKEYEEEVYPIERRALEGFRLLAESALQRVTDNLEFVGSFEYLKSPRNESGELVDESDEELALRMERVKRLLDVQKKTFEKEKLVTQLAILDQYTKPNEVKKLQGEIDKLKADEDVARAAWEAAKERLGFWRARAALIKSAVSEVHVAELIGEAESLQSKAVALLEKLPGTAAKEGVPAEEARRDAEAVRKALGEARTLEDEARLRKAREGMKHAENLLKQP